MPDWKIGGHFEEISKIVLPSKKEELSLLKAELIKDIEQYSPQIPAARIVSDYKFRVAKLLPQNGTQDAESLPALPWYVLCIDDEKQILNNLQKAFNKRGD